MSILSTLESDDSIQGDTDSVGSFLVDSAIHRMNIELAYIDKSMAGALSFNLHMTGIDTGSNVRQTFWISSGDAKGNKSTYIDAKGKKQFLPDYKLVESMTLAVLGKRINALETVEKVVDRWDFDAKAEIPQKTLVVEELLGQEIQAGIIKQTVDKMVKADNGSYVPDGTVKDENKVTKFWNAQGLTSTEVTAGATEGKFTATWAKKWTGQYPDISSVGRGNTGSTVAGAVSAFAAPAAATSSLFKNV
jgi:hypothetical protein